MISKTFTHFFFSIYTWNFWCICKLFFRQRKNFFIIIIKSPCYLTSYFKMWNLILSHRNNI